MTADGKLPAAEKRNYTSVFNALARIVKEEGAVTMWRGAVPTMGRAMVVNAAQLASYSQAKQSLIGTGGDFSSVLKNFYRHEI
jgi:solute carrier family 25 oxoglutarate transporter 11